MNYRVPNSGFTRNYRRIIFRKRQICIQKNSSKLHFDISPRFLIILCSPGVQRKSNSNCLSHLTHICYAYAYSDYVSTSIILAHHSHMTRFSRLSKHTNFILQCCHIAATSDKMCQINKANMTNQMHVILVPEVLYMQSIS